MYCSMSLALFSRLDVFLDVHSKVKTKLVLRKKYAVKCADVRCSALIEWSFKELEAISDKCSLDTSFGGSIF